MKYWIDNLEFCNWSREVFQINREAQLDAVHVTIVYHEDYKEFLKKVEEWDVHFKENKDLIFPGKNYKDIEKAKSEKKTAIFFWVSKLFTNRGWYKFDWKSIWKGMSIHATYL